MIRKVGLQQGGVEHSRRDESVQEEAEVKEE